MSSNNQINVMHVIGGLHVEAGGPTQTALKLCLYLKKIGVNVLICTTNFGIDNNFIHPLNSITEYNGVNTIFHNYFKLFGFYCFSPSIVRTLKKEVINYDLIHIHSIFIFTSIVSGLFARNNKIPYIVRPHGSLMIDSIRMGRSILKKIYLNLIEKKNLENASAIHFTTEHEAEKTMSMGLNFKKKVVIPNGIDPDDFKDIPLFDFTTLKNNVNFKDKIKIVFLGRIAKEKGLDTLLFSFAEVVKKRKNARLFIIGPDQEGYLEKLLILMSDLGLCDFVNFIGPLYGKDKLSLLKTADIFVLPSYGTENFGISAVEAMYLSIPIIITNNVGICREVKDYKAGFVINKNEHELFEAIISLIDSIELRIELGKNGKKLVEREFTWEKSALMMLDVYKALLSENRKGNLLI